MAKKRLNNITYNLNFVQDYINEFPEEIQGKENVSKFMEVALQSIGQIRDEIVSMAYFRLLDNAEGVVLDNIAAELNLSRFGQTDAELRGLIKLRALRQRSEGQREEVLQILRIISNDDNVKLFKGRNGYIELIFTAQCLNDRVIKEEIEDLFPIDTNLTVGTVRPNNFIAGFSSIHREPTQGSIIGTFETVHTKSFFDRKNMFTTKIFSSGDL